MSAPEQLATRFDLKETELRLLANIGEVKTSIADAQTEILKWFIGIVSFQTVTVLGTIITLVHFGYQKSR